MMTEDVLSLTWLLNCNEVEIKVAYSVAKVAYQNRVSKPAIFDVPLATI